MKTKSILFNTDMVQAILEGRKTQTRRIIKPQPEFSENVGFIYKSRAYGIGLYHGETEKNFFSCVSKYQKGDILWVRETWALDYFGKAQYWHFKEGLEVKPEDIVYKASSDDLTVTLDKKWKPSIFMPKAACRIFLKVTDVRVERLQDITEDDAEDEGIEFSSAPIADTGDYSYYPRDYMASDADGWPYFEEGESKRSFRSLWESIHGKGAWEKNPWVWCYSFERIEKPENF